ncbi:MAG: hypothetical protein WAM85_20930 [Terracidiphilus sp.]
MTATSLPSGVTASSAADQIDSGVGTALTAADGTAADRIQSMSLVHQARASRLTRTATALTAQYGASSPQATAAQAAVTATQATVARVQLVQQQASTTEPVVASDGWVLHGRVYDAQLNPAIRHTVFLVDAQKNYLNAYGFAYTDSTGYFLISYGGSNAGNAASNPAPAQGATELFVEIANPKAQPVYLSTVAFQPTLGNATYQNITLPAGEPALGDPPPEIRRVALPPNKRS